MKKKMVVVVPQVTHPTLCYKTPPLEGLWKDGKLIANPMEHCTFKKGHKGRHQWEPK